MEQQKKKAVVQLTAMVVVFLFLCIGAGFANSWWLRVPLIFLATVLAAFLVRIYMAYKRKKFYFEGKVLSIKPPKGKVGRHEVILKNGKISKKLYSLRDPKMKIGAMYGVYFEDKSFEIFQSQAIKPQLMRVTSRNQGGPMNR